jgi:hypothetical protein
VQLIVPLSHQLLGTLQRVVHVSESTQQYVACADKPDRDATEGQSLGPGR